MKRKFYLLCASVLLSMAAWAGTVITCQQAQEYALSVSGNNVLYNDGAEYTVYGYVTAIQTAWSSTHSNVSFWVADTENGGKVIQAYRCVAATAVDAPNVGAYVEVTGTLTKYGTTPEFSAGCTCTIISASADPQNLGQKTISEFKSMKNPKDTCVLTGLVTNILNSTYGNFWMTDLYDSLYVYGLLTPDGQTRQFASMDIAVGDEVTLKAVYAEYNNSPQATNAIFVSRTKAQQSGYDIYLYSPNACPSMKPAIIGGFNSWSEGIAMTEQLDTNGKTVYYYHLDEPEGTEYKFREATDTNWSNEIQYYDSLSGYWYNPGNNVLGSEHTITFDWGDNTKYRYTLCTTPETPESHVLAVEQAVNKGMALGDNQYSQDIDTVVGYVLNPQTFNTGYMNQTWFMADDAENSADLTFEAYNCTPLDYNMSTSSFDTVKVLAGDYVYLVGKLYKYVDKSGNVTVEIKNGIAYFIQKTSGDHSINTDVQSILPSAAVSIGNSLAQGASTEAQYQITGYVSALAGKPTDYSRYGNQNFWITNYSGDLSMSNANGAFYVFNGVASQAVKVGDYVTLTTTITNYNGVIESSSKRAVTILQEAPAVEPISPFVLDLTSFSDLGNWQIENATFNSLDGNKYIYDVGSVVAGTSYIGYFPNVRFEIANTKGKTDAFRVSPGKYFEFSGKNGVVHVLNTQAGDIIRITCASKGSTPANFNDTVENIYPYNANALSQDLILPAKNSEGADADGYVWRTLEWQSTGGDVSIKEIAGGFRIREVEVAKSNVEPGQNITVKLRTNGYWQNVYLYAWTDSYEQLLGSWPGTEIFLGTDTFYTYTFENLQDNLNIIWNNGDGAQTADLAVEDNTCYVLQNNSGAIAVLENCILTPEPEPLRPKNGDIWPIWLTGQAMAQAQAQNSLVYDFSNNSVDRNFYIWENTYTTSGDYGYNSYGEYQWYYTLTVGSEDWAGAGLSLRGSDALTAANQLRRAIVADPEHFYLHIAVKASDNYSHAFNIFDSEYTRFTLGRSGIYESPVYDNFQRDGQWHEFNIPLAQYAEALSSITLGENGNIFTVLSEGVQGATINLDAIYFYYSNSDTPQPTAPTPNDLTAAGYNLDSDVVLCVKFTEDATVCNDIYFVGSFSGWESNFTGCPKFNELQGFEGWYVASQPYSAEFGGKPIQARSDGSFTWNNQCGDAGAWTYVNGYQAYIENGYSGESNVSFYYPGPYIYEMSYWKDHVDPCVNDTMYQVVVRLVAPQNPPTAGVEIIGTFDNWDGTMMTRNGNTYTATVTAAANDQFKFREAYDTNWSNEILYLDTEDGYWSTLPDMTFSDFWSDLSEGVKQITLDFSNPSQFVWLANVMPQNLQAQLTSDAKLRVTWDAVAAASSYRVQIMSPQDADLANAIEVTNNSYLSVALTMNGNYTVYVTALDAEGRAMAYRYIKVQVEVPSIPMVTIQGYAPTDCNMDVSNGLWLVWRPTGQEDWNTPIVMQRQNAHSFTVSFAPNAPSYDYYFINRSSVDAEDVTSCYYWEGRTEATHCSEILYARAGDEHGLRMVGDCQFQDHNYAITNPQATVAAGRVDFSWTALGDIAESYTIYICDTAWSVQEYITVHNATSYSWGVSDEWDGQQICWAVRPEEPYQHAYAFGSDILTLQKSSIELVNLNMSLSNDQKALNLSWNYNSTNLHYLVEITIDGVVVKRQIVTSNNYVYTAPFDTWYSAYITPLNLNNEVVGSRAYAGDPLRATGAPEPYTNMQGVATGRHIDFTWQTQISQSRAIVVCQLSNGDRHFVLQTDVQQNTLAVDVEADGEYYLYLEPYLEYETGKLVLVERWWNTSVQVYSSTTTTFPVNITAGAGGYLSNGNINAQYAEGTTLYVYANPNEGYYFAGWSDGEQSSSRTIYVDHAITLQANFARAAAVTLVNMPHGTVNIDGEFVDVYNNVYYFKPGTQITLEAVADEGYRFLQWWDGNKAQPRTLTVQGDMTISATFEAISPATPQYLVTITTSGTGNGTVDVPSGIYYQGDVITITATPAANSVFAGWTDGNTDNPRTVTVTGPMTLNAIFNLKPAEPTKYTVTFLNWDGTVLDSRLWEEGTTPSYSGATPTRPKSNDTIFVFAGWTPTIVPVTANATYTATYTATKEEVKYTITFKNWDDAILEAKQWKAGEMPSCSVTPTRQDSDNYAFVFAGWEPEIVAVTADATYKATFTKQAKSFWVTFYDWDGETIIERQRVKRGEAAKLPEPPVHEGYVFVEWEVDRGDLQKVTTTIKATAVYVEAQGLNDVEDGNRARKIMRDGQILIIRNGKTYTMQGQIVE